MKKENVEPILDFLIYDRKLMIGVKKVFEGENISFHVSRVGRDARPHFHKIRDEIYYVYQGKGRMRTGKEYQDIKEGDIIFIPKNTVHQIVSNSDADLIIFFISSPAFDPENDRFEL